MNTSLENKAEDWKTVLSTTKYRWLFITAFLYFSVFPWKADDFFQFIQLRDGFQLNDYILQLVPAGNNSHLIFGIIYVSVIYLLVQLVKRPKAFIGFAWAFNIETTLRFICIYLIPLNPPMNLVELHDPLAELFIYGDNLVITKDLFFSGHTATMIFVSYFLEGPKQKKIAIILTSLLIILLLIQHIHYSIDIIGAILFTWLSIKISKWFISF